MIRCISYLTVALCIPLTAYAQMSDSATGRYTTFPISQDMEDLPDGTTIVNSYYHQAAFADKPGHPIDNTTANCVGLFRLNEDGSVASASGSCFSMSADGDQASFWWRATDGGTTSCPDLCGVWGYFAGTGKLAGIAGEGTWTRAAVFADGSSVGKWTGSYKLP